MDRKIIVARAVESVDSFLMHPNVCKASSNRIGGRVMAENITKLPREDGEDHHTDAPDVAAIRKPSSGN